MRLILYSSVLVKQLEADLANYLRDFTVETFDQENSATVKQPPTQKANPLLSRNPTLITSTPKAGGCSGLSRKASLPAKLHLAANHAASHGDTGRQAHHVDDFERTSKFTWVSQSVIIS